MFSDPERYFEPNGERDGNILKLKHRKLISKFDNSRGEAGRKIAMRPFVCQEVFGRLISFPASCHVFPIGRSVKFAHGNYSFRPVL